nr:YbhB/YbcL family Raf kinase inhibitor-like protein [uncultured Ligilactobacillus sp.]
MKVYVPLEHGFLPDKYGAKAAPEFQLEDHPIVSFPIKIQDIPTGTKTLALTLIDFDAIPVCGFAWIHWLACNIPVDLNNLPENSSQTLHNFIQGKNSLAGSLVNGPKNISQCYIGPRPPEGVHNYTLTIFALDTTLPLQNGYWLNDFLSVAKEHIITKTKVELPYEA